MSGHSRHEAYFLCKRGVVIVTDQFSRSRILLGTEAMDKLRDSRVAIFGIGGVGSYAAEALVRCGIGHFILIDSDTVSRTNINRQIHATTITVGQRKTAVMAERMRAINPAAEIRELNDFYTPDNHDGFFAPELGRIDYIVDAIDTVRSKIDLICEADKRGIPIISSMGAGNKLNPAALEVADIYDTSVCPLARALRHRLKKAGIKRLKVVYSREIPLKPQCIEGEMEEKSPGQTAPGSVSFVPSVAGLIAASEVVKDLCGIKA